ncbi:MAG: ABC transporter permease [Alphaproteobacteria bacterium]
MSPRNPPLSLQRIGGMSLRYLYLTRRSWPRLLDLVYWPVVQMVLWGLVTKFFVTHSSWLAQATGVLIAAVLLWDVLFRGQLGVSISFMEELYSRNLGHIFVSPLRPYELVCALMAMSIVRTVVGMTAASLLAIALYHYSIFSMGLALVAFFTNLLVMGWAIGLIICGLLLRYGLGADSMAWVAIFAIQPISGIYYPIGTLPEPVQVIAYLLPSSHVFEGMRAVLIDGVFRTDLIVNAVELNAVWLVVGALVFLASFRAARRRGLILQIGE